MDDTTINENVVRKNKELVEKHPYLIPTYEYTGMPLYDYDYSFTFLDDMPPGWKTAFGERMCDEITEILKEYNYLDKYRVVQVKEKFGQLRWYDNGSPDGAYEKINDVLVKYEHMSEVTCVMCGKPATKMSTGWISPYCDECAAKLRNAKFVSIDRRNDDLP